MTQFQSGFVGGLLTATAILVLLAEAPRLRENYDNGATFVPVSEADEPQYRDTGMLEAAEHSETAYVYSYEETEYFNHGCSVVEAEFTGPPPVIKADKKPFKVSPKETDRLIIEAAVPEATATEE